jgi:hypothetical protein
MNIYSRTRFNYKKGGRASPHFGLGYAPEKKRAEREERSIGAPLSGVIYARVDDDHSLQYNKDK